MINDKRITKLAKKLIKKLAENKQTIVLAESCTGGMIASAITDISGSSEVFYGGFVTYANQAKVNMLGVDESIIAKHGAASRATAIAMAEGALKNSSADIAIAVTGVAGPTGGTVLSPVGMVWIAIAKQEETIADIFDFSPRKRDEVRQGTVVCALVMVLEFLSKK